MTSDGIKCYLAPIFLSSAAKPNNRICDTYRYRTLSPIADGQRKLMAVLPDKPFGMNKSGDNPNRWFFTPQCANYLPVEYICMSAVAASKQLSHLAPIFICATPMTHPSNQVFSYRMVQRWRNWGRMQFEYRICPFYVFPGVPNSAKRRSVSGERKILRGTSCRSTENYRF